LYYLVIGQSGVGKTTFVKQRFITDPEEPVNDLVYITRSGEYIAIGKYGIDVRTEGTDYIHFQLYHLMKEQIARLAGAEVIIEGAKITNNAFMEFVASLKQPVKLYLLTCGLQTSLDRLRAAGSDIPVSYIRTTRTKAKRVFLDWGSRFNGEIIDTERGIINS